MPLRPLTRLTAPLTAVALTLGVVSVEAAGAPVDEHEAGRPHPTLVDHLAGVGPPTVPRSHGPEGRYLGSDGVAHQPAPFTVLGQNGYLFFGEDFDAACFDADHFEKGLRRMRGIARILREAGKRVLFSVAPNKSGVLPGQLADVPHGSCDRTGLRRQAAALDSFEDPDYIPMRARLARLARGGLQPYWHIDTHWTTVASTRYAHEVARHLDPQLARRQRYAPSSRTIVPDVMLLQGAHDVLETAPARLTTTRVRVVEAPLGADGPDGPGWADQSWDSQPSARTWRGKTLLVGDSFTQAGLESLRPLFRHGRFLWIGLASLDSIAKAMAHSHTVVLEIIQRYVGRSVLLQPAFRRMLVKSLDR